MEKVELCEQAAVTNKKDITSVSVKTRVDLLGVMMLRMEDI